VTETAVVEPRAAGAAAGVDYDLHGLVGIRVIGGGDAELRAVDRQLGPLRAPLGRDPDVVVRFVDELPVRGPVRLLDLDDAGFDDDAFLVLRSRHKSRARVRIPVEQIGARCEIVAERGVAAVPLLIPIVNYTALAKGALPLHASAFVHEGRGVVVTGWTKGGKTEALLAFAARGARYVGDEWVYLVDEGRRVVGIPEPIRLWSWHLRQLEGSRAAVPARDRRRLALLRAVESLEPVVRRGGFRALTRAFPLVKRQLHADVEPGRLFPGAVAADTSFDRLFFAVSHEADHIAVEPVDPADVARRMVFSLQYERLDLTAAYLKFRFAFPDRENPLIEEAERRQRQLLARLVRGKSAFVVRHPYPLRLADLYEAMRPYC
jgi:hypothetical protein